MHATIFSNQQGERFVFRQLHQQDTVELAHFFAGLSDATRSRYAPHPMTAAYAHTLCSDEKLISTRYVICTAKHNKIIGYLILDNYSAESYPEDAARYQNYQLTLSANSKVFAPCITDDYQSKNIASAVMPALIQQAQLLGTDQIILMGGTQKTNVQAVRFYQKAGFLELGQFTTLDKNQQPLDNLDMALTLAVRD
ncbi:GNAT family N-acetyltransferase [Catenovulum sp. SX2]|uniref:GNAT family N-acetyltransferase n=1 Tax=Catenovulum sp. SX2 TaxID=3398614 RepID=UPI003F84ED32